MKLTNIIPQMAVIKAFNFWHTKYINTYNTLKKQGFCNNRVLLLYEGVLVYYNSGAINMTKLPFFTHILSTYISSLCDDKYITHILYRYINKTVHYLSKLEPSIQRGLLKTTLIHYNHYVL